MIQTKIISFGLIYLFFANQILAGIPGAMVDSAESPISIAISKDSKGDTSWFYVSPNEFKPFSFMPGHPFLGPITQTSDDPRVAGRILFTITAMKIKENDQKLTEMYQDRVRYDRRSGLYIQRVEFGGVLDTISSEIPQEFLEQMENDNGVVDLRICLQISSKYERKTQYGFASLDQVMFGSFEVIYASNYFTVDSETIAGAVASNYPFGFSQISNNNENQDGRSYSLYDYCSLF